MLASEFAFLDRMQHSIAMLRDDVSRLTIRLAAVEAGKPLQPDQTPTFTPTAPAPTQIRMEDGSPAPPEIVEECRAAQAVLIEELNMTTGLRVGEAR